jgi:hypothetical protein
MVICMCVLMAYLLLGRQFPPSKGAPLHMLSKAFHAFRELHIALALGQTPESRKRTPTSAAYSTTNKTRVPKELPCSIDSPYFPLAFCRKSH